uniref:Kinesin motor domain-containing protein n=1 Tax=Oncorhynchus mykiss TaxID=8022 RepID=A0A8K9UZ58_ONCMY
MMESCFYNKLESVEREVNFDDLKKDLFSEFNSIDSQESCLEEHEHLQVYLRIRPFTTTESEKGESQDCVSIERPDTVLLKAPRTSLSARLRDKSAQRFQFSQVLGPETTQREMFDSTVRGLVKEVLEGGNSLVFTYGVTNAGKTFTFLGPEANGGILPRSLNVIFNSIEGRVYDQMTIKPQRCREFIRLTKDQQSEEATNKRNLFRLLKEVLGW